MSDITLDTAVAKAPEAAPRTPPLSQIGLVGWLRANLVERVKSATSKPVEHVVSSRERVES